MFIKLFQEKKNQVMCFYKKYIKIYNFIRVTNMKSKDLNARCQ